MRRLQWGHVNAAIGTVALRENAGGRVCPGGRKLWELRELMGGRFSVDVGSKACDRERDVRGR